MTTASSHITLQDMAGMPLFQNVAPESVDGVLEQCRVVELLKNEILMHQGEPNSSLYVVLTGELLIRLDSPDSDPIATLGRGETIGEMSMIDNKGASAYVMAASDSRLLVFEEESIWAMVRVSHPAACNLLSIITSRLRHANIILSERMRLEYDFHNYGTVDALSGLHNRYWFNHTLPRMIKRHRRNGKPLSMIMTDIDHFREFNTLYGHQCGDHVIHTVAQVFIEHLRPSELAARYGGDEFVILLPGVALEHTHFAAERLRRKTAESVVHLPGGSSVHTPTISAGLAQYRKGDTVEEFIAAADQALFRAKGKGRNIVSE